MNSTAARPQAASARSLPDSRWPPAEGWTLHLTDRLALRIAADYRRLAIPALEGTERVFMEGDADHHLGMVRVTVGFVLSI